MVAKLTGLTASQTCPDGPQPFAEVGCHLCRNLSQPNPQNRHFPRKSKIGQQGLAAKLPELWSISGLLRCLHLLSIPRFVLLRRPCRYMPLSPDFRRVLKIRPNRICTSDI